MRAVPVPSPAARVPARRIAAGLCLTLLATFVVVAIPTVSAVAADPHPVAPTIHTLALHGVDSTALTSLRLKPAAVADTDAAWTRETAGAHAPAVLTGQVMTAGFSAVGVTWTRSTAPGAKPPNLQVAVRTYDGSWQPWTTLEADADLPTAGAGSGEQGNGRGGTDPYFAGPSTGVQVRVDVVSGALPADLRVELVDPGTSRGRQPPGTERAVGCVSRCRTAQGRDARPSGVRTSRCATARRRTTRASRWRSSITRPRPTATPRRRHLQPSARSMPMTPRVSAGRTSPTTCIVDKYGQVFEGRAGGLERAVRSAATGGFNPSTFSVSALGTYTTVAPTPAMVTSIERILAWKLGLYHLNPLGTATLVASSGDGTTSALCQRCVARLQRHLAGTATPD